MCPRRNQAGSNRNTIGSQAISALAVWLAISSMGQLQADNGALVFVAPLDGVTIDGDLSDWPPSLPAYSIRHVGYGQKPDTKADASATFRVGFDTVGRQICIAVDVSDDSTVNDDTAWNSGDNCAIFFHWDNSAEHSDVQTFGHHGPGILELATGGRVGMQTSAAQAVYEWRIPLKEAAVGKRLIGFDIAVNDKDDDGSFSCLTWGVGMEKDRFASRLGDLVLIESADYASTLAGKMRWNGPSKTVYPDVRVTSSLADGFTLQLSCNENGCYAATLPVGEYCVSPISTATHRVVESSTTSVHVRSHEVAQVVDLEIRPADTVVIPNRDVFPGLEWTAYERSEDAGYSRKSLDDALKYVISETNTTGLFVVVGGKVLLEYGDVAELSYVASVRKSILAMLYAKYIDDGTIDLDTTLDELRIDDNGGLLPIEKQATIRDLITARSGVYHPASNPGDNSEDAPSRGSQKPGKYFLYNNWDFNAAGAIFEVLTGKNLYDALERDLARPIGMQDFDRWEHRKTGDLKRSRHPAYHIVLSTRDMARLGYLMLRQGRWNGEEVLPAHWVQKITSVVTPREEMNPLRFRERDFGYGYMWWIWDGPKASGPYETAYSAKGAWGQYITVLPALDMVVAHKTKDAYRRSTSWKMYEGILQRTIGARMRDVRVLLLSTSAAD